MMFNCEKRKNALWNFVLCIKKPRATSVDLGPRIKGSEKYCRTTENATFAVFGNWELLIEGINSHNQIRTHRQQATSRRHR